MNESVSEMSHIIKQALIRLSRYQNPDGYFPSLSSSDTLFIHNVKPRASAFITSLILLCLQDLPAGSMQKHIADKGIAFLMTQRGKHWSFNYWVRNSPEAIQTPYPDDLDCTFCALNAIQTYRPNSLTGKVMAGVATLLTSLEVKAGGPYRTWLISGKSAKIWRDVDPAVNANIAYFLQKNGIDLPKLNKFIDNAIITHQMISPYYVGNLPIIYFISRYYRGENVKNILKQLHQIRSDMRAPTNQLNLALFISAVCSVGAGDVITDTDIQELKSALLGPWQICPFIIESDRGKVKMCAGSEALTGAMMLEAIGKYLAHTNQVNMAASVQPHNIEAQMFHEDVMHAAETVFLPMPAEVKLQGLQAIGKTVTADTQHTITLLDYWFAEMIDRKGNAIPRNILVKLGVINLLGWVAYTIYDDFLDEEGDPRTLSVANISLRTISNIASRLFPKKIGFDNLFNSTLDTIEAANSWETTHCRISSKSGIFPIASVKLPDWGAYRKLAERSLGHALGPMAILLYLGVPLNNPDLVNLQNFFIHYIIAKQLNDDAHDWKPDVKNGQLTPIVTLLLHKYKMSHPEVTEIPQAKLITELTEIFNRQILRTVCLRIRREVKFARQALGGISMIEHPEPFDKLLEKIDRVARITMKEQADSLSFLEAYQRSSDTT
jgi:hypothetical protein